MNIHFHVHAPGVPCVEACTSWQSPQEEVQVFICDCAEWPCRLRRWFRRRRR